MENTLTKQWNLHTLYPGGKHSKKLLNQMEELEREILHISEQLQQSLTTEEIENLLSEVQLAILTAFQIDEFAICLSAEDVKDEIALKLVDKSSLLQTDVKKLEVELDGFLRALGESQWRALLESENLSSILSYLIQKKKQLDEKLPHDIENAINTLSVNGFQGWENHHEQFLHNLNVTIKWDGETKKLSLYEAFIESNTNKDREKRKVFSKAIQDELKENADEVASIFNHFSGFRLDTYKLKGYENTQKEFYEKNRIDEEAVASMLEALQQNQIHVQRFWKRKAQFMGIEKLSYYDIDLPYFSSKATLSYEEGSTILSQQFHAFSKNMGNLADRAFQEGWIDAEARDNKSFGAFCAAMPLENESRILLSFKEEYQDVVTLAHELGHAYHNSILQREPAFTQGTGSALAETASTFAENLVLDAAIQLAETEEDQLSLLEMKISNGVKYISNIPSMFDFEKQFYEKRKEAKLSSDELSTLLVESEKRWTNNSFAEYNPTIWMLMAHLYDAEKPFYPLSYTIGYLFSNGIYALSKTEGEDFHEQYEKLLSATGKMSIEELGLEFLQRDLKKIDFWEQSIEPINEAIEEFIRLTDKYI